MLWGYMLSLSYYSGISEWRAVTLEPVGRFWSLQGGNILSITFELRSFRESALAWKAAFMYFTAVNLLQHWDGKHSVKLKGIFIKSSQSPWRHKHVALSLGQILKATLLFRAANLLTLLTFAGCFSCMKVTLTAWSYLSGPALQPVYLLNPFPSKALTPLISLFIITFHCFLVFFSSLFSIMTVCLITKGEVGKKATRQISPLKWDVSAGDAHFCSILSCCNQRERRFDCYSHHQRLMANQTGGRAALSGFLQLSCTRPRALLCPSKGSRLRS